MKDHYLNKSKILSDIKGLIRLLRKYSFDSFVELYQLENILGKSGNVTYGCDIKDLTFNHLSISGMKANPKVAKLSVSIDTNYTLIEEMTKEEDIFGRYSFELYIKGYDNETDSKEDNSHFFCWHLDKETNTEGDFVHPLYHFHAGGNKIIEKGIEVGELMFIGSPRIPHPPMDIILAIHFIIQNFVNNGEFAQKQKLFEDDDYKDIIERARNRTLDPYFQSIAGGNNHRSFTKHNLFPLYL